MKNQDTEFQDIQMDSATGKANAELFRMLHPKKKGKHFTDGGIFFVISREEIENGDISRIIGDHGPQVTKKKLRQLQNRVHFTVDGYDDDPRELFEIPEVREYYLLAHRIWGGWSYFADIRSDCLKMVACCLLNNLTAIKRDGDQCLNVRVRQDELLAWFVECLQTAAIIHARVGLTPKAGVNQLQGVANYLEI